MTAASPPFRPVLRLVYPPGYPAAPANVPSHAPRVVDEGLYAAQPVEVAPLPEQSEVRAATRAVARENRRAATLSPDDARKILAVRIAELLQGGRAAILTPEHRARAIRISRLLGVRDFDAHLVIALVQDRARRGEIVVNCGVNRDAIDPARLTGTHSHDPANVGDRRSFRLPVLPDAAWPVFALQFAAAALLAAAMLLGLLAWLG